MWKSTGSHLLPLDPVEGYENYDLQEEDPYLIPGSTCLRNLLGITDTQSLNEAEAALSEVALAELIATPIPPTFDLFVHRHFPTSLKLLQV